MCEIVIYPAGDSDIPFLPYNKEIDSFNHKDTIKRGALVTHLMSAYFHRAKSKGDASADMGVLKKQYYDALNQESANIGFDANAWLADSVMRVIHASTLGQWARSKFKHIYIVFTMNLVIFFATVILLAIFGSVAQFFSQL